MVMIGSEFVVLTENSILYWRFTLIEHSPFLSPLSSSKCRDGIRATTRKLVAEINILIHFWKPRIISGWKRCFLSLFPVLYKSLRYSFSNVTSIFIVYLSSAKLQDLF